MTIRLLMLGKTRRAEVRALFDDYLRRLRPYAQVEATEVAASPAALRKVKVDSAAVWVLLDADGKTYRSQQFARWLADLRDRGTRELVFLCGDDAGFPDEWRSKAQAKLSLSGMTLPHELARVVLAEQLYRAFSILAGHPYHK